MTGGRPGPFRLLVAHFMGRFFRSEHTRYEGAVRERLSGLLSVLTVACPIIFFEIFTLHTLLGGGVEYLWPFGAYYFGSVIIVLGFLAVLVWEDLLPDEVDQAVLTALPVPRGTLMWAKAAALGILMGVGVLAMSGLTPLVFASFMQLPGEGSAVFLRLAFAYFGSAVLAGVLAFTTCGALRGLTMLLADWRVVRRASSWIQSAIAFALVSGFAMLPPVADRLPEMVDRGSLALLAVPPAWFVGLAKAVGGNRDPAFSMLAQAAVLATATSTLLFVGALSLGFRRFARLREDRGEGRGSRRWNPASQALNGLLLRHPQERATFWFFVRTLWRGPRQRMRLLSYLAVAAGWVFIVLAWGGGGLIRAAPIAAFLAVVGVRSALSAAFQERANWIVKLTEGPDKAPYRAAVRWGVWLAVLAPVFLALSPSLAAFGAIPHPGGHLAFHFLAACLLAEALVVGLPRFPFSSVTGPGHHAAPAMLLVGLFAYVGVLGTFEDLALTDGSSYLAACGALGAAIGATLLLRRRSKPYDFVFLEASGVLDVNLVEQEDDL